MNGKDVKEEIITNPDQVNNETIYSCTNCNWKGTYNERKRKRDEKRKGFYLICPECEGDSFNKLEQKTFMVQTFSVDPDMEDIVRRYTMRNGLPTGYKFD